MDTFIPVIVVVDGSLKSTVLFYKAVNQGYCVYPVIINKGKKAFSRVTFHLDNVPSTAVRSASPLVLKKFKLKKVLEYADKLNIDFLSNVYDYKDPLTTDLVREGLSYGVIMRNTWDCDKSQSFACTTCPSCRVRIKSFVTLRLCDPIAKEYIYPINWINGGNYSTVKRKEAYEHKKSFLERLFRLFR